MRPSPAFAWIVAGATITALAAVLLVRLTSPASFLAGRNGAVSQSSDVAAGGTPAPDISGMTPRERADRLFNRVMSAAERSDTAQIRFFAPMAVQAYALLGGELDADARYHVGMIQLIQGNGAAARAQADSISRASPNHLLASLLRAEVARRAGDAKARDTAWRELLRNWDREMGSGKTEYEDHRTALEAARAEARKALGER